MFAFGCMVTSVYQREVVVFVSVVYVYERVFVFMSALLYVSEGMLAMCMSVVSAVACVCVQGVFMSALCV